MRSMISAVMFAAVAMGGLGLAQAQTPAQPVRAAYTVEPFTPSGQITIQGTGVRLRAEPFATTDTPVLSTGSSGLPLNVIGIARLPDWNWYQVILKSGQKAFIRSDLTSAPSKGGAAAPVPPARVDYPSAAAPVVPPALPSNPAFSAAAPPALTPIDTAPLSAPGSAAVSAPTAPAAPVQPTTRPNTPSAPSTPPVSSTSRAPLVSDAPIALTPRSSPPPATSDPSGLESKPPG